VGKSLKRRTSAFLATSVLSNQSAQVDVKVKENAAMADSLLQLKLTNRLRIIIQLALALVIFVTRLEISVLESAHVPDQSRCDQFVCFATN